MINKGIIIELLEQRGYGKWRDESWESGYIGLRSICGIEARLMEATGAACDESNNWKIQLIFEIKKGVHIINQFNIVVGGDFLREEFIKWESDVRIIREKYIEPHDQLVFTGPEMSPVILQKGSAILGIHPITFTCDGLVKHFGSWLKLLRSDLNQLEKLVKVLKVAKLKFKNIVEDITNE